MERPFVERIVEFRLCIVANVVVNGWMLAMGASLVLQYSYRKMPFHTGLEKSKQKRNFDGYHTTDIM